MIKLTLASIRKEAVQGPCGTASMRPLEGHAVFVSSVALQNRSCDDHVRAGQRSNAPVSYPPPESGCSGWVNTATSQATNKDKGSTGGHGGNEGTTQIGTTEQNIMVDDGKKK
jgi:hypothetical protein